MAPEILEKDSYLRLSKNTDKYVKEKLRYYDRNTNKVVVQHTTYDHKADMWAVGCVAYILACHTSPFLVNADAKSQADLYKKRLLSNWA
jgi:serine/threonine protein kinase